jgi:hypothetical protein
VIIWVDPESEGDDAGIAVVQWSDAVNIFFTVPSGGGEGTATLRPGTILGHPPGAVQRLASIAHESSFVLILLSEVLARNPSLASCATVLVGSQIEPLREGGVDPSTGLSGLVSDSGPLISSRSLHNKCWGGPVLARRSDAVLIWCAGVVILLWDGIVRVKCG